MDEPVWLIIGVISVIIGVGAVLSLFGTFKEGGALDTAVNGLNIIQVNTNFVCHSPDQTKIFRSIDLPSGMILETDVDRVCVRLDSDVRCVYTECNFTPDYYLDLNTSIAKETFTSKDFRCSFEKVGDNVSMGCQG